jgi:hypothetical protein
MANTEQVALTAHLMRRAGFGARSQPQPNAIITPKRW